MRLFAKCMSTKIPNRNGRVYEAESVKAAIANFNNCRSISFGNVRLNAEANPADLVDLSSASHSITSLEFVDDHAEIYIESMSNEYGNLLEALVDTTQACINIAIIGTIEDDVVSVQSIECAYISHISNSSEFNTLMKTDCTTCGHNSDILECILSHQIVGDSFLLEDFMVKDSMTLPRTMLAGSYRGSDLKPATVFWLGEGGVALFTYRAIDRLGPQYGQWAAQHGYAEEMPDGYEAPMELKDIINLIYSRAWFSTKVDQDEEGSWFTNPISGDVSMFSGGRFYNFKDLVWLSEDEYFAGEPNKRVGKPLTKLVKHVG